jgi:anti-sigma B factor antagonist
MPVELLQWSIRRSPQETTVFLIGEVDLSTADALSDLLDEVLAERPRTLAVDVALVSFLDSTGIKCLLTAATSANAVAGRLVVRRPTDAIEQIFKICGVAETLLEDLVGDASTGS